MADPKGLWREIKLNVKKKNSILYMMIQDTNEVSVENQKLVVNFPAAMKPNYELAIKPDRMDVIKQAAQQAGCPYPIMLVYDQTTAPSSDPMGLIDDLFGADQVTIKD